MSYAAKLAVLGVVFFFLSLGFFFAVLGDPSSAADNQEPQPQPQAKVAPVQNPRKQAAAAYLDASRPLVEKWRIKYQQMIARYAGSTDFLMNAGPAVFPKLSQDLVELKAISSEVRALTPPDCLDRAHRFYLGATGVAEGALGTLGEGFRHNSAQAFEVAALQIQDTTKMFEKATAEMNRVDCA